MFVNQSDKNIVSIGANNINNASKLLLTER